MYSIKTSECVQENFFAGDFPVKTDFGSIKAGAIINKHAPIIQGDDGIEEATAETLEKFIGISADIPSGSEITYYMTGEFFTDAIYLPEGISEEALKLISQKLGIFLRHHEDLPTINN